MDIRNTVYKIYHRDPRDYYSHGCIVMCLDILYIQSMNSLDLNANDEHNPDSRDYQCNGSLRRYRQCLLSVFGHCSRVSHVCMYSYWGIIYTTRTLYHVDFRVCVFVRAPIQWLGTWECKPLYRYLRYCSSFWRYIMRRGQRVNAKDVKRKENVERRV